MKVKLHNDSNSEQVLFVPGIGSVQPGEWVELDDAQVEEFKAVNGFDLAPTNNLEIEGQDWPPTATATEPETDVEIEEVEEEEEVV